jgi:hypothetical protein
MKEFDRLIGEQLQTMEKLLFLQSEIERCQEIEQQLCALHEISEVDTVREEIEQKKMELEEIQEVFERQTEEVIHHFQLEQAAFL